MRFRVLAACAVLACVLSAAPAAAKPGIGTSPQGATGFHKALYAPAFQAELFSNFSRYHGLGASLWATNLRWDVIATRRPKHPRSDKDAAYDWPEDLSVAVSEATDNSMGVVLTVVGTPSWANKNKALTVGPEKVSDFQGFLTAAAHRYPDVRVWRIWDDTNTADLWSPQIPDGYEQPLAPSQQAAPRRYARLLDGAYTALKAADPANIVVGGNTTSYGTVSARHFIQAMVLPSGKPPRMDVYGHSPYGDRPPELGALPPLGNGRSDFNDLPLLAGWVDRYLATPRRRPPLRIFLAKFVVPAEHPSARFSFFVPRDQQAQWITDAYRAARSWKRIWGLGYEVWQDDPPNPAGTQFDGGLLDFRGAPKPAYAAFAHG